MKSGLRLAKAKHLWSDHPVVAYINLMPTLDLGLILFDYLAKYLYHNSDMHLMAEVRSTTKTDLTGH
jgi:hypothetical protein